MKSPLNPLGILLREQVCNFIIRVRSVWCIITVSGGRGRLEINGIVSPVNLGIPLLKPRHSKDNLGLRKPYNHEFYCSEKVPEEKEAVVVHWIVPQVFGVPSTL